MANAATIATAPRAANESAPGSSPRALFGQALTPPEPERAPEQDTDDSDADVAASGASLAGRAGLVLVALLIAGGSAYLTTRWMQPAPDAGSNTVANAASAESHPASAVAKEAPSAGDASSSGSTASSAGSSPLSGGTPTSSTSSPSQADSAAPPRAAASGTADGANSSGAGAREPGAITSAPVTPGANLTVAPGDTLLEVHTTPAGARVVVAGAFRGLTPLIVRGLPPGRHDVLVGGSFGSILRYADITAGRRTRLDVATRSASPAARGDFEADPPAAEADPAAGPEPGSAAADALRPLADAPPAPAAPTPPGRP